MIELNRESPRTEQPQHIRLQLKEHQLTTLHKMFEMDQTCKNGNLNSNIGILGDLAGYGKCHGKGTLVLLYNGKKVPVETIQPGNLLMGPDSKHRTVLTVNSGFEKMYRITLQNGDSFTANESHVLSLKQIPTYYNNKGSINISWIDSETMDRTSIQINDSELHFQNYIDNLSHSVLNISIKNYLKTNSPHLSLFKAYKSIPEYGDVKTIIHPLIAGELYASSFFVCPCNNDLQLPEPPFYKSVIIPEQYSINSLKNKQWFLNGLLNKVGSNLLKTTIYKAALEVLDFSKSIGLNNSFIEYGQGYYNVNIDLQPQLMYDFKIEPINETEYFGFTLTGDHLYLLGDYTVTHNTITMLSLLCKIKEIPKEMYNPEWFELYECRSINNFGFTEKKNIERDYIKSTLIVVPKNVIKHWEKHLRMTNLNYSLINKLNHNTAIQPNTQPNTQPVIQITNIDCYLCPSDLYNNFIENNNIICWDRVIFDEADSIYIPHTRNVEARYLWLISSTWRRIAKRTNKGFLKNLFDIELYYRPQYISDKLVVKCQDDYCKESFELPEPNVNFIECLTPSYINAIRGYVDDKIQNLVNAGDINGAIISLGGDIDIDTNIIQLVIKRMQNNIIEYQGKIDNLQNLVLSPTEREQKLHKYNTKLHFLNNRITEFQKNIQENLKDNCVLCADEQLLPTILPCCKNIACGKCVISWLNRTKHCPFCRTYVNMSDLATISINQPDKNTIRLSSKVDQCLKIIQDKPNGRFIIVSEHIAIFNEIKTTLNSHNIRYGELTTLNKTERVLREFRNDECNVILLGVKYNGAGIEITEASDIIIIHKLETSAEKQAVARAQRPGRKESLNIHKLYFKNEYGQI